MRLKTFYAKTMTEAMQLVRDTLGDEAVIVATREEQGGKSVRVTAAVEPGYSAGSFAQEDELDEKMLSDNLDGLGYEQKNQDDNFFIKTQDIADDDGQVTEVLTDVMLRHVVPSDVTDHILSTASMTGYGTAHAALSAALEHLYTFVPIPMKSRKAIMLVGPAGVGKTLATAKMATGAVMDDHDVAVFTTDIVRAGGVEQLKAFTDILKIPLGKADKRNDLNLLLNQAQGSSLTVVDTAGVNPHDPDDMARLARLIDAGTIEPVLVLPAAMDADESAEIARSFALLGVQRLMITRLDVARRLGGLLSAAQRAGMSFCNASLSHTVTSPLFAVTPQNLADFLISPDQAIKKIQSPTNLNESDKRSATTGRTS